ncbi:MAG: hypothetical protein H6720_00795 [Sandaracinus sp.]|nr:hypothetical protein [Sandaracinus sp.]
MKRAWVALGVWMCVSTARGQEPAAEPEPSVDAAATVDAEVEATEEATVEASVEAPADEAPTDEPTDQALTETTDASEEGEIGEAAFLEPEAVAANEAVAPEADAPAAPTLYRARGPFALTGEYRFRFHAMTDLALQTQERTGYPDELGQNLFGTQWLRLTPRLAGRGVELVGQIDLFDGVVFGDRTVGVDTAELPRDEHDSFRAGGVDPRWLYLSWRSPVGLIRAGLQPSHWGLGLLANDGDHEVPFGDYRYGNRNIRLLFATRPFGADVPFNVIVAGDLVYSDPIAQLRDDERAWQAVMAALYGDEDRGVGAYVVYRHQTSDALGGGPIPAQIEEKLKVWIVDFFARWEFSEPSGGKLFAGFEGAYFHGTANLARTTENPQQDVRQGMWAMQVGREGETVDAVLEGGWTSGDANPEDDTQRRSTMHPDHRIGLILFPELLAWSTARAANLARSDELVGRPSPGSDLLPTDGGVSGAAYLFNHYTIRPVEWLDLRAGWVWGRATTDVVDPYRARAESRQVGWRGGDRRSRDLGVEVDASAIAHLSLPRDLDLELGIEGGVAVPGRAFDDADGGRMSTIGLLRLRAGLAF